MSTRRHGSSGRGGQGRPVATTHAEIEQVAFRLFAQHGFEGTTMAAIAREVGVGPRTLFRYYGSKNDIPWGQFAWTLDGFRRLLDEMPPDLPLHLAVHRGVLRFNDFPAESLPTHHERMRLILQTPALQAHSVLRYADWREVISDYVARRLGLHAGDLYPQTVAQVSLALALTAYAAWLAQPGASLPALLEESLDCLRDFLLDT